VALFYMTIPLMVLAILVAAVPLVVVSRREVTELVREAEKRFERHQREHPGRHRITRSAAKRSVAPRAHADIPQQRPWHQPVLLEDR
jgi:hypothetical protein